ncbi:MAG: F0F1 ATP synthase subunit B [Gammaproteobacteria bacterium]
MSINFTLIAQMVVFALLVWFTMRFVWPMILRAMEERNRKIADGLAAAEQGERDLVEAKDKAGDILREARAKALQIVEQANHRANEIVDEARNTAVAEGERLIHAAQQEIEQETQAARDALRREVAAIALAGASRLLEREIDPRAHADLLDGLAAEIRAA